MTEISLSVVHVVDTLHRSKGGPARAIVDLNQALERTGTVDSRILSHESKDDIRPEPGRGDVRFVKVERSSILARKLGLPIRQALAKEIDSGRVSIVHSHGLWNPPNHWACMAARSRGISFVVQPHGMLGAVPLRIKRWKKRVALSAYQRWDLESAGAIIATAPIEYDQIRRLGYRAPVAIVPIGVDIPRATARSSGSARPDARVRTALHLSRITPHKGLKRLVQAWAALSPSGWRLRVAGPDEQGYWKEVAELARQLHIENSIEFIGEVYGDPKAAQFRDADLFVLPSDHENFGMVIPEALSCGLPVITTRGTPWQDLESHRCGWWVQIGVEPLVHALREAMALSDQEREAMGCRARTYVARFDWDAIAAQTAAVYRWILGQGDRPDNVEMG